LTRKTRLFAALGAVLLLVVLVVVLVAGGGDDDDKDGANTSAGDTTTTTGGAAADDGPKAPAPLTGLPMPAAKAKRPLLIVKVDNDSGARPQAGLNEADVVAEQMVEGGVTRFAALYHSTDAEVGPVRSARSTDVNFATSFNRPLFAYSGASSVFEILLRKSVFIDVGIDAAPGAYTRRPGLRAPSNLFSTTEALFGAAKFEGSAPTPLWRLRPSGAVVEGDTPAGRVDIVFPGPAATKASWQWDAATGAWLRSQNNTDHVDAAMQRISAANVIVHFAAYKDSAVRDRSGAAAPEAVLVGKGEAWYFVDGKVIKGEWEKPSLTKPTEYRDGKGQPMVLAPGRTWIELAPPGSANAR
jgi:Protein of unknown function (DUF3048) N-terminal domain/Protein of unknown function (DUF3048) C-terminal domain